MASKMYTWLLAIMLLALPLVFVGIGLTLRDAPLVAAACFTVAGIVTAVQVRMLDALARRHDPAP